MRDIATNCTSPATLLRHTGQGARECGIGKPGRAGRTAEIERKFCLRGAAAPARKQLAADAILPWQESGLAKIGEVGKALVATQDFPPVRRVCRPAAFGGFLLYGFWVSGLAQNGAVRAADSARTAEACYSISVPAS